jgi:uncharacterized damage-inducible protein DinB
MQLEQKPIENSIQITPLISKHFRELHFGENWTSVSVFAVLSTVNWKEATRKVHDFNTIAALTYHIGYFTTALLGVLECKGLSAHDKYSFDHPPINSEEDWQNMLEELRSEVERTAALLDKLDNSTLTEFFVEEKYGSYYYNLHGIIEHSYYHLGQIVMIRKTLNYLDNL